MKRTTIDLEGLLARLDPDAELAQRHLWLIAPAASAVIESAAVHERARKNARPDMDLAPFRKVGMCNPPPFAVQVTRS